VTAGHTPREHEEGLALFIEPNWRARFRDSLDNDRLRKRVLFKLDHFRHLDPRFTENLPRADQRSEFLLPVLRGHGAPARCYLMSSDPDLDRRELPLGEALALLLEDFCQMGTLLSCIPGRLAYFHDEEYDNRHILRRPA